MRILRHGLFLFVVTFAWPALAACSALTSGSEQERGAFSRIMAISEVKAWLSHISSRPNVHAAFVPAEGTQVIAGRCYWKITLYSDEGSHLHLWNTFFVSATGNGVLIVDNDGNPLSVRHWRSIKDQ